MAAAIDCEDVVDAARTAVRTLAGTSHPAWDSTIDWLGWNIRSTLEHMLACVDRYSLHLAARAVTRLPNAFVPAEAAAADLLELLEPTAVVLAAVASASPPEARGYHAAGMADASGFVAMACDEILIHTWDIATNAGLNVVLPDALCDRVLRRLFPWTPDDLSGPEGLLWANDRISTTSHDRPGRSWVWHCAPLDEWDGTVPVWDQ